MADKARVQLLVDALRSGEFTRTEGALEKTFGEEVTNCCLGVACRVALANGVVVEVTQGSDGEGVLVTRFDGSGGHMPHAVYSWFGFEGIHAADPVLDEDGPQLLSASELNDAYHFSFTEIADAFERKFLVEQDGQDGPVLVPGQEA